MIDIVILILLALAAFSGWRAGAVTMLLSLVVLVLATYIASIFGAQAGNILKIGPDWVRPIVGFAVVFLLLIILGSAVKRTIRPKSGLTRSLDQSIGALLGVARGVIILSFILLLLARFDLPTESARSKSRTYRPILECSTLIANVLRPLLPTVKAPART